MESKEQQLKRLQEEIRLEENIKFDNFISYLKDNKFIEIFGKLKYSVIFFENYENKYDLYIKVKDINFHKYSSSNDCIRVIFKGDIVKIGRISSSKYMEFKEDSLLNIDLDRDKFEKHFRYRYSLSNPLLFNQSALNKHFDNLFKGLKNFHLKYRKFKEFKSHPDTEIILFCESIEKKFNELVVKKNE